MIEIERTSMNEIYKLQEKVTSNDNEKLTLTKQKENTRIDL